MTSVDTGKRQVAAAPAPMAAVSQVILDMDDLLHGGGIHRLDLGNGRMPLVSGGKRSVHLMELKPMGACRHDEISGMHERLLTKGHDLDGLGAGARCQRALLPGVELLQERLHDHP